MVQRRELENRTQLVVDATGVGRAVTDMLHAAKLNPVRITITSGIKAVAGGVQGAETGPGQQPDRRPANRSPKDRLGDQVCG
jgi:hypothetical protein